MHPFIVLTRKELSAALLSPIAYIVAAVFLLVLGYTFSLTLFATKVANLQYIFRQIYVLSILLVPVLTMRAFAEERRSDTLELLLTTPIAEVWIVLSKYIALMVVVLSIYALSSVYALLLGWLGEPDWGPILTGYATLVLLASLLVSVGVLASSLTENQVISAALSMGIFLMLWFADSVTPMLPIALQPVALNLSLIGHFKPLVTGSVFLSDAMYFVSITMVAIWLASRRLADR
ncbi:ABC transporter permease subunit [Rhodoferax sp.]|uniref:ABC transporter permease n=1 Tax=Rhodoferax sp. TaxID=50421 RepID=UPI002634DF03|nr:ABC transporter permease subunit [Rhodoferax sp.]MDD2919125.1 ABC transporter permease subunit [Rhodoferax sp.]